MVGNADVMWEEAGGRKQTRRKRKEDLPGERRGIVEGTGVAGMQERIEQKR